MRDEQPLPVSRGNQVLDQILQPIRQASGRQGVQLEKSGPRPEPLPCAAVHGPGSSKILGLDPRSVRVVIVGVVDLSK